MDCVDFEHIENYIVNHYNLVYFYPPRENIMDIMDSTSFFNWQTTEQQNQSLMGLVSMENVFKVRNYLYQGKAIGLYVCIVYQFLEFLGHDLLDVIEELKLIAEIHPPFTSIFIGNITKEHNPYGIYQYKPISLFTCLYKFIRKTIAGYLKDLLSKNVTLNNFIYWKIKIFTIL